MGPHSGAAWLHISINGALMCRWLINNLLAGLLGVLVLAGQAWGEPRDAEQLLSALTDARLNCAHILMVRDITLRRGGVAFTFERGVMAFYEPVEGVVTGLYFSGSGTVLAIPPARQEKEQLNLFSGAPILEEHFNQALIRFSDDTYDELLKAVGEGGEWHEVQLNCDDPGNASALKFSGLTTYRMAADFLDGRKMPMFYAQIFGTSVGVFDFTFDRRREEDVLLGQYKKVGEVPYYDTWCHYSSRVNRSSQRSSAPSADISEGGLVDATHYQVETKIDAHDNIEGSTEIEYTGRLEGEWVLSFDLARSLKVSSVVDEKERPLVFFQNGDINSEKEIKRLGHDVVQVLLKEPLHVGEARKLKFVYAGDVISRVGDGMFYVGSRGSWYPNAGFRDHARYDLEFQYPRPYTIVATGDLVKEWEEGNQRFSVWRSEKEIPLAGFNYGDYVKKITEAGKVKVEVYANRGIENVYREALARRPPVVVPLANLPVPMLRRMPQPAVVEAPALPDLDTTQFAESIANQIAKALLYYEQMLGSFPYDKLAVSQISGTFGQGWPSLLYVSSLSFLSSQQRALLHLGEEGGPYFWESMQTHELAHQWLGNQTVSKSYHDLWIYEGFATYLGYLSLNVRFSNDGAFLEMMRRAKAKLEVKNKDGVPVERAGPVWLGTRLSSSKFPSGYDDLVYNKGAWIIHMLRYLLSDPATGSDQLFRSVVKEFLAAYNGKLAGTEDLKAMIEKRLPRSLYLEGSRKLDWFFDEWVYGTGIPTYRISYSVSAAAQGGFLLKGKVIQESVPEDFTMPVDVFARYAAADAPPERLGRVVVTGKETAFHFTLKRKPAKVMLDANQWILCNNKTL